MCSPGRTGGPGRKEPLPDLAFPALFLSCTCSSYLGFSFKSCFTLYFDYYYYYDCSVPQIQMPT